MANRTNFEDFEVQLAKDRLSCLITFLHIAIEKAGGELRIEKVSSYIGRTFTIEMTLKSKADGDYVVVTSKELKR